MWKTIDDYPSYKVSDSGVVINAYGKVMAQQPNYKGYLRVYLVYNKVRKQQFVHRLVAKAFVPNPNNLPQINHKDGHPENNHSSNLEWCDNTYNQRYSHAIKVNQYSPDGVFIKQWNALSDIEEQLHIPTTNISKCCKGIINTINGFIFLYTKDSLEARLLKMSERKHKSKAKC